MLSPRRANRPNIDHVRILCIYYDSMNMSSLFKTHQLPRFSRIQAFINTITPVQTISGISLAGTDPYNIRIGLLYSDSADRQCCLTIKNRFPINSGTFRFPNPTRCCADIDNIRLFMNGIYRRYATAHARRAYTARLHPFEQG